MTPASLFGRDSLLESASRALDGGARVLALVGPPGVGKTAVARALAEQRADRSTAWCELTSIVSADGVLRVVGGAVEVPLLGRDIGALGWALEARGALMVVLDGVDAVFGELHALLTTWTERAPECRFLLTSRRHHVPGAASIEVLGLDACAGRELLIARSGRSLEDFAHLDEIVERLDGLPLALELAGARLRALSPKDLGDRLTLDLLRDGPRTLRSAIDASWQPLEAALVQALSQCSVFPGAFSLAGFEAVVHVPDSDPLRLIQGLVDRSLVQCEAGPSDRRYRVLGSVRDFVAEQGPPEPEVRARLAQFTLERARRASGALDGRGAHQAIQDLQESAGALEQIVRDEDPDRATEAVCLLGELAAIVGPVAAHVQRIEAALSERTEPRHRAALLISAATVLRVLREHERSGELLAEAPALVERLGEDPVVADLHRVVGTNAVDRYAFDEGAEALWRAIGLYRARGARKSDEAEALRRLATAAMFQGQHDEAGRHLDQALVAARKTSNLRTEALVLSSLGSQERHRGALPQAEAFFRRGVQLHRQLGDRRMEATLTGFLALTIWDQGRLAEAAELFEASAELGRLVGDPAARAASLAVLAVVRVEQDLGSPRTTNDIGVLEWIGRELAEPWAGDRERALLSASCGLALQAAGQRSDAIARYRPAVAAFEEGGGRAQSATFRAFWAVASPDRDAALRVLDEGHALVPSTTEHRLIVALARDRVLNGRIGEGLRADARKHPRGFARLLITLCDRLSEAATVAADGTWFETPELGRVGLERKRVVRRVLAALAAHHQRHPNQPLALPDLFAAAWPGEVAVGDSGDARVHVAISTLRKLGLRDALVTHKVDGATGYALGASVQVRA